MAGLRVIWLDAPPDRRSGVFPVWLFSGGTGNSYSESVTDGLTAADSLTVQAAIVAGLTDGLTGGDSVTVSNAMIASVTDGVTGGESLSAAVEFVAGLTDGLTGGDSITVSNALVVSVTDGLTGGDTLGGQVAFSAGLTDGLTGGETIGVHASFVIGVTDGATGGDSAQAGDTQRVVDSVTAADSVAAQFGLTVNVSDSISAGDLVTVSVAFSADLTDGLTGTDSIGGNAFSEALTDALTARDRVSSTWTRYRATTWAGIKRVARRAVHEAFGVAARYQDSQMAEPVDLTVRWHAKGLQSLGDIQNDGFAEMLSRPDRLVFWREELDEAGIRLRHGGRVMLTEYGDAVLVLDTEEPADGPGAVAWTVARANPDETFS